MDCLCLGPTVNSTENHKSEYAQLIGGAAAHVISRFIHQEYVRDEERQDEVGNPGQLDTQIATPIWGNVLGVQPTLFFSPEEP